ncbi:3645_t:CDS:2, partial [Gigaspora rosea]
HQSHKASQCSVDKRKAAQHEKYIIEINQTMMQINDDELQLVYQDIIQQSNSQEKNKVECHQKLIDFVKKLPDNHLKSAINLFDTMRYTKGQNKGNLLSPFLQNKALNFINSSLYKNHKVKQLIGSLSQHKRKQCQHISRVRAAACKPLIVNSQSLKVSIQSILMKNKHQYSTYFVNLATQISQVNQISFRSTAQVARSILGFLTGESFPLSISKDSIIRWNKEISEIHINKIFNQNIFSEYFTFDIMLDEST